MQWGGTQPAARAGKEWQAGERPGKVGGREVCNFLFHRHSRYFWYSLLESRSATVCNELLDHLLRHHGWLSRGDVVPALFPGRQRPAAARLFSDVRRHSADIARARRESKSKFTARLLSRSV